MLRSCERHVRGQEQDSGERVGLVCRYWDAIRMGMLTESRTRTKFSTSITGAAFARLAGGAAMTGIMTGAGATGLGASTALFLGGRGMAGVVEVGGGLCEVRGLQRIELVG